MSKYFVSGMAVTSLPIVYPSAKKMKTPDIDPYTSSFDIIFTNTPKTTTNFITPPPTQEILNKKSNIPKSNRISCSHYKKVQITDDEDKPLSSTKLPTLNTYNKEIINLEDEKDFSKTTYIKHIPIFIKKKPITTVSPKITIPIIPLSSRNKRPLTPNSPLNKKPIISISNNIEKVYIDDDDDNDDFHVDN